MPLAATINVYMSRVLTYCKVLGGVQMALGPDAVEWTKQKIDCGGVHYVQVRLLVARRCQVKAGQSHEAKPRSTSCGSVFTGSLGSKHITSTQRT